MISVLTYIQITSLCYWESGTRNILLKLALSSTLKTESLLMNLSGSNLFCLFFPLIFKPYEQSVVISAAAYILVWEDSFGWVGLGYVMWGWVGQYCSAGEYRCDDNGLYSMAPKLSSIQPTPTHAYIYSPTTASKLSLFFSFSACLRSIPKPPKQPHLHSNNEDTKKGKKCLRRF